MECGALRTLRRAILYPAASSFVEFDEVVSFDLEDRHCRVREIVSPIYAPSVG